RSANFDLYAQRVNAAGVTQWTADGVAVSTFAGEQSSARMVTDGAGGAIIAWIDKRNGADFDIYGQRVNSAGTSQWTANGVAVCTAPNSQSSLVLSTDGAGGAVAAWSDARGGGANTDVYAQRIRSSGTNGPDYTLTSSTGSGGMILPY